MNDDGSGIYETPRLLPCGDAAVSVVFGGIISRPLNRKVQALTGRLRENPFIGLIDLIPSYRSLLIQYDPGLITWQDLQRRLWSILRQDTDFYEEEPLSIVEIPVCYGGEFGPDLQDAASYLKMSPQDLITIHSASDYYVYMIGFTPGFPFLGGLDPRLIIPRRAVPREKVPAGSVGIAGQQAGIYSVDSPGGWHLIGRTPIRLFDLKRPDPVYLKAGCRLRFKPIAAHEFNNHPDH